MTARRCCVLICALCWSCVGVSRSASAQDADLDPRIIKLVATVSEERLGVILKKLESFETRSTLSSTTSTTRGIGAARQWILDEMKSYSPKLQVSFDTYQVRAAGAHHARRRAPQRDGGPAGTQPAADLHQRPLRHGGAPGGQGAANAARAEPILTRARFPPPIPTRRSTTSRPASTTTAAARR